ncbi:MAG: cytidylate kinase-like family protein [Verrucomicrobiota bacterium]
MTPHADQCLSFLSCQLNPETRRRFVPSKHRPSITISRQIGCGSMAIAEELCTLLQAHTTEPCHWTVFDKNLVEKVLEEHKLPKEVAKFMQEDHVSAIQDAVEEILGLHPSSRTLWQQTSETILHLAELGQVILMGRAANVITREMNSVFHVRLIAPLEIRVQQVMARDQLDHKTALRFTEQVDAGRRRYLKDHFHTDIDDSLQYDLVINTARLPHQAVARLIGDAVLHWGKTLP